jgi:hypothetical protein
MARRRSDGFVDYYDREPDAHSGLGALVAVILGWHPDRPRSLGRGRQHGGARRAHDRGAPP